MTTGWGKRDAGRKALDSVARMTLTTPEPGGRTAERDKRVGDKFGGQRADQRATMAAVTDLAAFGWTAARAAGLPIGSEAARVSRVDRGRLSVLTAAGERRVHPGAALYDESGVSGPAVGDW